MQNVLIKIILGDKVMIMLHKIVSNSKLTMLSLHVFLSHFFSILFCVMCLVLIEHLTYVYLNPFTGQDVYRRPELATFQMGRTYIGVLTGLAVSDMGKSRYLVL